MQEVKLASKGWLPTARVDFHVQEAWPTGFGDNRAETAVWPQILNPDPGPISHDRREKEILMAGRQRGEE